MSQLQKTETLFRTPRFDVCKATVSSVEGHLEEHYYISKSDAVSVLAVKDSGILLLKVKRPMASTCYELPGGVIEKNESPVAAAERELLEETGLRLTFLEKLGCLRPLPMTTELIHVFIGPVNMQQDERLEPPTLTEGIESLCFFTTSTIQKMIEEGDIGLSADVHALILGLKWIREASSRTHAKFT